MPRPLANIWDIVALPTGIRTTVETVVIIVMVANIATIVTAVIVIAVGAILAMIGIVNVILTVVIAATVSAIGAGAPLLVVIRPTTADAGVTPEVLPEAVAQLVRQGTLMAPPPTRMTAPAGKFDSNYLSMWRFVDVLGFRTNIVAGQG